MKRPLRNGKKALAAFMAVLMMLLTLSVVAFAEELTVTFVNPYATGSIDKTTDLTVYKTETLQESKVENGGTVSFSGKTPTRRKDAAFGKYSFAGWSRTKDGAAIDLETTTFDADTTLYATFEGEEVYYKIDFRSDGCYIGADGTLYPDAPVTDKTPEEALHKPAQTVKHGEAATPPSNNPVREPQEHYTFKFTGWDYDYTHIYKEGSINAEYSMQGKQYNLEYYDWDGTTQLGTEVVTYGEPAAHAPTDLTRKSTEEFHYVFANKWNTRVDGLLTGKGVSATVDPVSFPEFHVDDNPDGTPATVKLYAQYKQQLIEYAFTIRVIDANGEVAEGVDVSIMGADKNLLTTFTDENFGHNGGVGLTDENGEVHLSVPYQTTYTLSAVDTYHNQAVVQEFTLDWIKGEAIRTVQLQDPYEYNGEDQPQRCNDICHSFIGNFWITGLNLFYRLFKVKFVCCYDMYATHKDRLVYASNSSGKTVEL